MKKKWLNIIIVSALVLLFSSISYAYKWTTVKWVNDGDTIVLKDDKRIRYIGMNAPEIDHKDQKAEPFGYKAKKYNKKLTINKNLRLEFDNKRYDKYGRVLAYIFTRDNTFINETMIKNGLAFCLYVSPNDKYSSILLKAQQSAMISKKGIWSIFKNKKMIYTGNLKSRRFHKAACLAGKKIKKKNKIIFQDKWSAFWSGFAPCKKCISNWK